jgi:hypothetical protein
MTKTAGTFTANRTRDAIALDHDGHDFITAGHISDDPRDGRIYEIQFTDGEFILVSEHDITWK